MMTFLWIILGIVALYGIVLVCGGLLMHVIPALIVIATAPYRGLKEMVRYYRTGQTGKAVAMTIGLGMLFLSLLIVTLLAVFVK